MRNVSAALALTVLCAGACALDSPTPPPAPPPALALGDAGEADVETTIRARVDDDDELEARGSNGNFLPDGSGEVRLSPAAGEVADVVPQDDPDVDPRVANQYRGLISVGLRTQEPTLTIEESDCAAGTIVAELGVATIAALDAETDSSPAYGEEAATAVVSAIETCVGFDELSRRTVQEYFAPDTDVSCLATEMTGATRNGFLQAVTNGADSTDSAFFDVAFSIALDDCDAGMALLFDGLRAEGAPEPFLTCIGSQLDPEVADAVMAPTATADQVDEALGPAIFACA